MTSQQQVGNLVEAVSKDRELKNPKVLAYKTLASSELDTKKVFIENLNYKTSWQDLKDYMKSAGDVLHAEIFTRRSGASKGSGYF